MRESAVEKMNDLLMLQIMAKDDTVDEFVESFLGYSFHIVESHTKAKVTPFFKEAIDKDIEDNGYLKEGEGLQERLLSCCIDDVHRMAFKTDE